MTQDGFYIDEKSLKALRINIRVFRSEVLREAKNGLAAFGMRIVARAKQTLKKNGNIAEGTLRDSGRTVIQPDGTVDAGFYAGYAYWVENGRKAGGMPPQHDLYQWLVKKRINPKGKGSLEQRRRDAARSIAWYIKHHGTKAHPFLKPAYEQYRWNINKFMTGVIERTVSKFKPKK